MRLLSIIALTLVLFALPAWAEKRVALVIGNGAYKLGTLKNPPNDARLISKTLRGLGFEVIERTNLTGIGMKRAISEFGTKLSNAGEDAVGMFFYAGHGVQAKGNNYLLPTDVELQRESDLELFAVRANWVLGQMEEAGNRVNLVVLDACRNNPFTRSWKRSVTRGLARMEAPRGTLIAYATRPGDVAVDGRGDNSPYTKAFAKAIKTPGLTLSDVFIDTRNAVMEETNDEQVPWEEGGLTSRFYFAGNPGGNPQVASVQPKAAVDEKALDLAFWNSVKDSKAVAGFEAYLSQYPDGAFTALAKYRIASLAPTTPVKPAFEVSALDEEMVTLKTSNVRSEPSTRGDKIAKINAGSAVNVTGRTTVSGSDWYQVALSDGKAGYVFGTLLREQNVAAITPVPAPKLQPTALVPAVGNFMRPGKVFKDCDDCPEMVVVPAGSFLMGDLNGAGGKDETPVHQVKIPRPFAVGKYEITQAEWRDVMGSNPSSFKGDRNPVDSISWNDAEKFVHKLSLQIGKQYRLLSESEWEYAARAGSFTEYAFGNSIFQSQANFGRNIGKTTPVGSYPANALSLQDMHGNVWEWVEDCYKVSYKDTPRNGNARIGKKTCARILRGGSWLNRSKLLRSANRHTRKNYKIYSAVPTISVSDSSIGFRVARDLTSDELTKGVQKASVSPNELNHNVLADTKISRLWQQANIGVPKSQYMLGFIYENGMGIEKDKTIALRWYKSAADLGNTDAQIRFGSLYAVGDGVPQNYQTAMEWYKKAADQGSVDAFNRLGWMYEFGWGVYEDFSTARDLYRKGEAIGSMHSRTNLNRLYNKMQARQ